MTETEWRDKMHVTFPPLPLGRPLWQRALGTALVCGLVAWGTAALLRPQGVDVIPPLAGLVAFGGAAVLSYFYAWAFSKAPGTRALPRYFMIVSLCLPAVHLISFAFAYHEFGYMRLLRRNKTDWPTILAQDILLVLPVFAIGAGIYLLLDRAPTKSAPIAPHPKVKDALAADWMKGFWIEVVVHANVAVLTNVVMGTGALALRLSLWFALSFLVIHLIQLLIWAGFFIAKRMPPVWVRVVLVLMPFVNWTRFPHLQEHGIEAVGSGIAMWTIALLTTAVMSSRLIRTALFVLALSTIFVANAFFTHQHADGWFEQATIAFVVGSFSLAVALAAYGIYQRGTEDRIALNQALVREREATRTAAVETERRRRIMRAVGHDLRQPLSALQLWLYTTGKSVGSEEEVGAAMASVSSAHEILNSISQLTWLVDGEKDPRIEPVPLGPFMDDLVSETRSIAAAAGTTIRCRPLEVTVATDPLLLRRILRNFVVNAIKHGGSGDVLVGARRRGNEAQILVLDQGAGLSRAAQQQIFEEFARASSERSEGIGIGLSVARDLADAMGLTISVDSKLGKGSAFSVKLPICAT